THTGIKDLPQEQRRFLYPNPSGNEITLPLEPGLKANSICIYDYNGNLMKKVNCNVLFLTQVTVNISDLPAGIYIANINYTGKTETYKFEKVR
ncbi:MAG: T9SS type A sorting domain-containing protein, partial [FCB group bacterium]